VSIDVLMCDPAGDLTAKGTYFNINILRFLFPKRGTIWTLFYSNSVCRWQTRVCINLRFKFTIIFWQTNILNISFLSKVQGASISI